MCSERSDGPYAAFWLGFPRTKGTEVHALQGKCRHSLGPSVRQKSSLLLFSKSQIKHVPTENYWLASSFGKVEKNRK